jgi:N-acetylglucosaminyldiphosphoundecaprenol N-acetyl-beta-D-mannosaminyltransferase
LEQKAAGAIRDDLSREVYCVAGIPIDAVDMCTVLRNIDEAAAKRQPFLISTPNLNFLVNSLGDVEFRESLLASDLCPADGMPIVWIARLLGAPIRQRIAGSDIFAALKERRCPAQSRSGASFWPLKIFLFGGTQQVAAEACRRLNLDNPGLSCVGYLSPGFGDDAALNGDRFIERINASNADFLVAALGARKGQLWLLRNHSRLRVPVRSHLGATINFQAGTVKRAPILMQNLGLEWLWRIKEEPALFYRYWHDGTKFIRLLVTHVLPLALTRRQRPWRARHDLVMVADDNDRSVTLRLSGDAIATETPRAARLFRDVVARGKSIELDLSSTKTVDARFLGLFLMLRKQLKNSGNALHFIKLPANLQRQFRLAGVEYLLSSGKR